MSHLKLFLETGAVDGHRAHIFELPGCTIKGRTRERLIDAVPQSISSHIAWLRSHDDELVIPKEQSFSIIEEKSVTYKNDGAEIRAWFSWDEDFFTETDFLKWLKVITYARNDLSERVMDFPIELLDWKQSLSKRDTVKDILYNLINREIWYLSRLKNGISEVYAPNSYNTISECLALSRTKLMSMLYLFFEHEKKHCVEYQHEKWSLKKIMRRTLELTLESLKEIDYIASSYWCKYNEKVLISVR